MLYPPIQPYDQGMLEVSGGNSVYWELCGNPRGIPVVVLHGGPGSGCTPNMRQSFDPTAYRILLFDQRNCGRSTPHAADIDTDLSANTTEHLLADMERLRQTFGIERWMLFGGSWGATLSLAYAERFPECVSAIVLWGTTMTRRSEIDWLYQGVAPLFPSQWSRFVAGVPEAKHDGDLVEAYYRRMHHSDPDIRLQAARDFHDWEWVLFSLLDDKPPSGRWLDPRFQLARGRIVTHYFRNAAWLEDGILLKRAHRLAGIPGVLVHGRLDLGSPLKTAWELHRAWPESELVIVGGAGHSANDLGMDDALIAATDRFAKSLLSSP